MLYLVDENPRFNFLYSVATFLFPLPTRNSDRSNILDPPPIDPKPPDHPNLPTPTDSSPPRQIIALSHSVIPPEPQRTYFGTTIRIQPNLQPVEFDPFPHRNSCRTRPPDRNEDFSDSSTAGSRRHQPLGSASTRGRPCARTRH